MSHTWPSASTTRTVGAGFAAAAVLLAGAIAAPSAQAAAGECVAIIPVQDQSRDMAHAFGANGPVIRRDSSGISPAETWRVFPIKTGVVTFINNLLDPTGRAVVASVTDINQGSKVQVAQIVNPSLDTKQQWKRESTFGGITYTNVFSGKRLTHRQLGGQDFKQWSIGIFNSGQFFSERIVPCQDNTPQ